MWDYSNILPHLWSLLGPTIVSFGHRWMCVDLGLFVSLFGSDIMLKYEHPIQNQLAINGGIQLYITTSPVLIFFIVGLLQQVTCFSLLWCLGKNLLIFLSIESYACYQCSHDAIKIKDSQFFGVFFLKLNILVLFFYSHWIQHLPRCKQVNLGNPVVYGIL